MVQKPKRQRAKDERPKDMQIKKPAHFDTKSADEMIEKLFRENKEWLKEMAKR